MSKSEKIHRADMSGEFEQVLSMGDKLGEHAGEWIAIVDGKIRASGNDTVMSFVPPNCRCDS